MGSWPFLVSVLLGQKETPQQDGAVHTTSNTRAPQLQREIQRAAEHYLQQS